jgi:pimeloyl-ACP methyl ester carboxylesterase
MALPNDRPRGYSDLAAWVIEQLPAEPVAVIAESFSGPLALLVADRCPRVTAIVLCASFVEAPHPSVLARLPTFIWSRPPPSTLISFLLTGGDRALGNAVRRAIADVPGPVIAARIAAALSVDVVAELERFSKPLLLLAAQLDRVIPARCSRRARALKPSAHFVELRAPHLVLQSHPAEAWRKIAPFLERGRVHDVK